MRAARKSAAERPEADDLLDQVDVPATVVCALCGDAECTGCADDLSRSGVVAVIAWERPGAPALARLWTTARATTLDAEAFFEAMPDGPVAPALRFAVACELLAASAMVVVLGAALAVAAPHWLRHLLLERGGFIARLLLLGVPSLAALLVFAHGAHGWALHWGARRTAPFTRGASRALRFGFYAAGWDVVLGPIGVVMVGLKDGLGGAGALRLGGVMVGLPGRSARALLRGAYRLSGDSARGALRASYVAAILATVVGTFAIVAGAVVVALM